MNSEVKREVLRGHLDECLEHLKISLVSLAPKYSRGAPRIRKPLADFCDVKVNTVERWLNNSQRLPIGLTLIKLMCCLDMVGYKVIEFERIPKAHRGFMELIGFVILSIDEAVEILGYNSRHSLFDVLHGRENASKDIQQKMWDTWKEKREELERKKEQALKLYGRLMLPSISLEKTKEKFVSAAPSELRKKFDCRQSLAVSIMEVLLVLLEDGPFDELSASELIKLKQYAANTILKLSARLSALSSDLIMPDQ